MHSIRVRYSGKCRACGEVIAKGETATWFPKAKRDQRLCCTWCTADYEGVQVRRVAASPSDGQTPEIRPTENRRRRGIIGKGRGN